MGSLMAGILFFRDWKLGKFKNGIKTEKTKIISIDDNI
jgi:hypothetical protein